MDDSDASALFMLRSNTTMRRLAHCSGSFIHSWQESCVRIAAPNAEEIFAKWIFIKVFQKLSHFPARCAEHWVSRIAVNTCLNQIESEKVRPELRQPI